MVISVDVDLPAIEVFKQLQDYLVRVFGYLQHLALILAHQARKHRPEFFTLGSQNGLMGVDFFVFDLDCDVRKVLLVEQLVFEVPDIAFTDLK